MDNNRIRERRMHIGISQVRLGILSEIPSSMISDFELGKRYVWPKARRALAKALGVSETELFPDGDKPRMNKVCEGHLATEIGLRVYPVVKDVINGVKRDKPKKEGR